MSTLTVRTAHGEQQFTAGFRIGRQDDCGLCLADDLVSRQHAEVVCEGQRWTLRDLGSTNGTLVNGTPITSVEITGALTARFGAAGPAVTFELQAASANVERYFRHDGPAGEHTMLVRQAIQKVQAKQQRRYGGAIILALVLALAAAGYAWYIHQQTKDQLALARELFYGMKALDVEIARLEINGKALESTRQRRAEMTRQYDRFLTLVRASDARLSPKAKLIIRVARIFGESELDAPKGFVEEVERYIAMWQSTGRFTANLRRAQERNYVRPIANEFLAQGLPPQFLYLAMQESNFDEFISGPPTRFGIAKGMWQFIPKTGAAYGLTIGPLVEFPRADPADDRHNWPRATKAAARYIKDLYATEAQASGLLVMACYNWGEQQVLPLVQTLPANPRERNFWRLLEKHRSRLPQETYDYVFYIVSAAAIGEDPKLFGFALDNPLAN